MNIDLSDIKFNIIKLKKLEPDILLKIVYSKLDVYSLGLVFSYFLMNEEIRLSMNKIQYDKLYLLCKKMINPYTDDRIGINSVLTEYEKIF